MDSSSPLKNFDRVALYAVVYTAVFIAFSITMPYILPFVLGTLIALMAQPLIRFFTRRFRLKRSLVGLIIVLVMFAVVFGLLAVIIVTIINELVSLASMLPAVFAKLTTDGYAYLDKALKYFNTLDPAIVSSIKSSATKLLPGSFTAAVFVLNLALTILKSLPGILMLILFTLLTSVYVAIDFPKLKGRFYSLFSKEDSSKARSIVFEANKMITGYAKAYLILISITFVEVFVGTSILGVRYAALFSLVTSISDLLPVLGPGTILIPTGVGFILAHSYVKGIGILVLYLIVTAVRQVLEPKVVSSSLGVYPLAIIVAIFIGLKAYGFTGMIFTVFFVVFYSVLKKVGVL